MYRQTVFPRWRGFNLLNMFCSEQSPLNRGRANGYFFEDDFKMISDFGFDFVRLPLSYRVWSSVDNPYEIDEEKISPLDDAVYFGKKYNLHVNICMHRLPGYCVNSDEKEKMDLWREDEALNAAVFVWSAIAKRYKDISSENLSFNVMNEPVSDVALEQYNKVSKRIIRSVREISADRLFIIDGVNCGELPPVDQMLYRKNCGYSCRGYVPFRLTHYGTNNPSAKSKTAPSWPEDICCDDIDYMDYLMPYNRDKLDRLYGAWAALAECLNVGVHCGEMGCFHKTPHSVTLAWYKDIMEVLKAHNIGYALWNFAGNFGIADSNRSDVTYKKIGHRMIDEKLLKLLQKY